MANKELFPISNLKTNTKRAALAPEAMEAWRNFSKTVFQEGELSEKTKQLIAVAVAHVTQCPYCIHSHTKQALGIGASQAEVMEAIWIAAEMRAGAAIAHSALAIEEMEDN